MNKLFAILIIFSLSFPVLAIEGQEGEAVQNRQPAMESFSPEEIKTLEDSSSAEELSKVPVQMPSSPYKEPMGTKKIIKKLLVAMLCVAGSSIFLYAVLSIYNSIRYNNDSDDTQNEETNKTLEKPLDITEAVKSFIERTRWY